MQHVCFVKGMGTCGSGERNVKILIDFRKSPRFSLTSPLSQLRKKSSRPVFTIICFDGLGFAVNFFNNGPHILKLIVTVRIYHMLIDIHLEKKIWFENWIYKEKNSEHL